MMKSIIDVFRMEEISKESRVRIIIELGVAINYSYGANITEPLIYELVKNLDPENEILSQERYLIHIKKRVQQ